MVKSDFSDIQKIPNSLLSESGAERVFIFISFNTLSKSEKKWVGTAQRMGNLGEFLNSKDWTKAEMQRINKIFFGR